MSDDFLRVLAQPDGKYHLVDGGHRDRLLCGLELRRGESAYLSAEHFGQNAQHCPECARIFHACRARFPSGTVSDEQKAVIDRIRKLLALAESPNESEAALASARAYNLLEKHNLTIGVVEHSDRQQAEKRMSDSLGTRAPVYKFRLASAVAHLLDVKYYSHRESVVDEKIRKENEARERSGDWKGWR